MLWVLIEQKVNLKFTFKFEQKVIKNIYKLLQYQILTLDGTEIFRTAGYNSKTTFHMVLVTVCVGTIVSE